MKRHLKVKTKQSSQQIFEECKCHGEREAVLKDFITMSEEMKLN